MILSDIQSIPRDLVFAQVTMEELRRAGDAFPLLEKNSRDMWLLSSEEGEPLFVCGVVQASMLGEAFFWFLMCEAFTRKLLRNVAGVRQLMEELLVRYPHVVTAVEVGNEKAERFAALFGWSPVGTPYETLGITYLKYKVGG